MCSHLKPYIQDSPLQPQVPLIVAFVWLPNVWKAVSAASGPADAEPSSLLKAMGSPVLHTHLVAL